MMMARAYFTVSSGVVLMSMSLILARLISLPAPLTAMLRGLIAWILLSMFFPKSALIKLNKGSHYFVMLLSGICLALSWTFLFESLSWTSVGTAATAYFMFPVWTVIRNITEFKPFSAMDLIMLLGVGGALYLLVPEWSLENSDTFGILLAFMGSSFAVFQRLIAERILHFYEEETILHFNWGIAALVLIPYGFYMEVQLSMMDIVWIGLLGSVCTLFAQGLFLSGFLYIPVNYISMIFCLQPLIVIVLARLFLGESVSWAVIAAAAIVSLVSCLYHLFLHFLSPEFLKEETELAKINRRRNALDYWIQKQYSRYDE